MIADNRVRSQPCRPPRRDAEGDLAAGEMAGSISNTQLTGNTVTVSSVAWTATALAGATIVTGTLTNSVVDDNHVFASSPSGSVGSAGGGLQVGGPLTLRNTTVSGNTGQASGLDGSAQGGGISDVDLSGIGQPPGGPLVLTNSRVVLNLLSGTPSITRDGGGIAATNNIVTLTNSLIAGNSPTSATAADGKHLSRNGLHVASSVRPSKGSRTPLSDGNPTTVSQGPSEGTGLRESARIGAASHREPNHQSAPTVTGARVRDPLGPAPSSVFSTTIGATDQSAQPSASN